MKNYYTKQEDGTFCLVTFTQTEISEILIGAFRDQLRSAMADNIAKAMEGLDLSAEAESALEDVDSKEIAEELVREEIQDRLSNADISVDVSI